MALSCLAGTNPVLPVNSRTSCPGKFENEIFLLSFFLFFWKNKLILPRACFNNYPSIFFFCFARVWNHSSVWGRKFHYLAIVSMTCSQSNNMTHFFYARELSFPSFECFLFVIPLKPFFFDRFQLGFCFVFLSPKRRAYFSIFFFSPVQMMPLNSYPV